MKFERDEVTFLGGVRHGLTLGSPIAIMVGNTEWPKWEQVMAADPVDPEVLAELARNAPLTRPRPGHADLAGMQKYGFDEARPILERASARETAARVALGTVARSYLKETAGIEIVSHVVELAAAKAPYGVVPEPGRRGAAGRRPGALPGRGREQGDGRRDRPGPQGRRHPRRRGRGRSPTACRSGLGSHVHWDRRLDARLAAALMGIQAIKGVEVGDGFDLARVPGSKAHDEIVATDEGIRRTSGRSGGTEGGLTTGELLRVRAAMKPIATVPRALATIDVATGEATKAHHQRSDVCAVPAAGIVAEAMVALVLADAVAEKFGGDSVPETRRNVRRLPRQPGDPVTATPPSSSSARWAWASPPSASCSPSGSAPPSATPTPTSWPRQGRQIAEIFVDEGEPHFRALEQAAVAPRSPSHDGVLALGGGAVLDAETRALLAGPARRLPRWTSSEAVKRTGLDAARPLLAVNPRQQWRELMEARRPLYTEVARAVVATEGRTPDEVADAVLDALELKEA